MACDLFPKKLKEEHFDYFVFGHRHLPLEIELNQNSKYINLGIGLLTTPMQFLMELL